MAQKKFQLTQVEYDNLVKEQDHLIHVEKPQVINDLALARSQGDLSENADYDAARDHQARLEARVSEISNILNNCEIVATHEGDTIGIGSTVSFKDLNSGDVITVRVMGNTGADPFAEPVCISNDSPLGKALIGHNTGDTIRIETERPYEIKITSIEQSKGSKGKK